MGSWEFGGFVMMSLSTTALDIGRSIVIRRFFFLIGTLYLYRCVTMYITTLPVPGMHMNCAPKVSSERLQTVSLLRHKAEDRSEQGCVSQLQNPYIGISKENSNGAAVW